MPERPVPFSLLDAARVVARGGTFDDKMAALTQQVRTVTDAGPVAILLHVGLVGVVDEMVRGARAVAREHRYGSRHTAREYEVDAQVGRAGDA